MFAVAFVGHSSPFDRFHFVYEYCKIHFVSIVSANLQYKKKLL